MKNQTKKQVSSPVQIIIVACLLFVGFVLGSIFELNIKPSEKFLSLKSRLMGESETKSMEQSGPTVGKLTQKVTPQEGYTVNLNWGDTGIKLVSSGAIDLTKFQKNYTGSQYEDLLLYLTQPQNRGITINSQNSYFWVNTLWALGLVQKSDVLEKGIMGTEYKKTLGNFASTGGWTLGKKEATQLFASSEIISLSPQQQETVKKIANGVFRPCCDNPTSFPDCNHGMAALGLITLMVSQGFSEEEIYKAVLAFNSYWFPTTYTDLAYYFETKTATPWEKVDPKKVLSIEFSSATGYRAIKQQIGNIPGSENQQGSSCAS